MQPRRRPGGGAVFLWMAGVQCAAECPRGWSLLFTRPGSPPANRMIPSAADRSTLRTDSVPANRMPHPTGLNANRIAVAFSSGDVTCALPTDMADAARQPCVASPAPTCQPAFIPRHVGGSRLVIAVLFAPDSHWRASHARIKPSAFASTRPLTGCGAPITWRSVSPVRFPPPHSRA